MARITVEDCIDKFPSRFELVLVASQRARKLHSGDEPTIDKDNDKNTVIALREIADTTISVETMKENLIQEYQTITISDEEEENLELESLGSEENLDASEEVSEDFEESPKNIENTLKDEQNNEIEGEMNELISSEDKEIESQYEIIDNLADTTEGDTIETIEDVNPKMESIPE